MISGILASPGIAFGRAILLKENEIIISHKKISNNHIPHEIERFLNGRDKSLIQIKDIQIKSAKTLGINKSNIFIGHLMILDDKELETSIINFIKKYHSTADAAVHFIIQEQIKLLENLNDIYLKERASDIRDIRKRLLQNILDIKINDLSNMPNRTILVTKELTSSEIVQLNFEKVLGFISDLGGCTSHTSIIARSLEIPAIVGTGNITNKIKNGDSLIIDALSNFIHINPSQEKIKKLKNFKKQYLLKKNEFIKLKNLSAITLDKYHVKIYANINMICDIVGAKSNGAEGIGLYRTEFLFMNKNSLPSEEEQFQLYKNIAKEINFQSVTIRTVDFGSDKNLNYIKSSQNNNEFLKWHTIYLEMDYKKIIYTQLRAILRASAFGKLRIMFPMIISVEEVRSLKKKIKLIKEQLRKEKKPFNEKIEIGIMIETPAAAVIVHHLAKEVDFFSIGTNDLIQYTLGIDRSNNLVTHLCNPLTPSILILIKNIIDAAHNAGKIVSMCGEMAGDKNATILLLGMGLDKLSMNAISIPSIKKIIRNINLKDAKKLTKEALNQPTTKALINLINKFYQKKIIF